MKRNISVLLVCILLFSVVSGCSSKNAQEQNTAEVTAEASIDSQSEAPAEQALETAAEITYPLVQDTHEFSVFFPVSSMLTDPIGGDINKISAYSQAEKVTNIHMNFRTAAAGAEQEQFSLMIASGDYTSLICNGTSFYSGGGDKAVEDNVFVDITDMLEQYAPNYAQARAENSSFSKSNTTDEGRVVSIDSVPAGANYWGLIIRQDWLDDLGLNTPKTYDDAYKVLKAFKTEKGAESAYMMISTGLGQYSTLACGYGVNISDTNPYYIENGKVKFSYIQDGFREYLTMLNLWYKDGLMTSDFMNYATLGDMLTPHVQTGKTGMWIGNPDYLSDTYAQASGDAKYKAVAIADLTKTEGEAMHMGYPYMTMGQGWNISTACDDVPLALEWFDYFFTDDGILLANWGVENEAFVYDTDGKPQFTDLVSNNPEGLTTWVTKNIYTSFSIPTVEDGSRDTSLYTSETQKQAMDIWKTNKDDADYYYGTLTAAEGESYSATYADISTYITENIVRFIIGDRSLDQWDDFIAQIKDMGIEDCVKVKQAAYERYINR